MKEKIEVYTVFDAYEPEPGDIIYGLYPTMEEAETRVEELSGDINEYGESVNKNDTIDIRSDWMVREKP